MSDDTHFRPSSHELWISSNGIAHITTGGELVIRDDDRHERFKMLCGTSPRKRSGLPLNGYQLKDMRREDTLCEDCFEVLREQGATLPDFLVDGDIVGHNHTQ